MRSYSDSFDSHNVHCVVDVPYDNGELIGVDLSIGPLSFWSCDTGNNSQQPTQIRQRSHNSIGRIARRFLKYARIRVAVYNRTLQVRDNIE